MRISIEYEYFINKSFWSIDMTLTGTIAPDQSGPESNASEGTVFDLPDNLHS